MNLSVILTPAEIATLEERDLAGVTCVVFDVLRATSTMLAALHAGADSIEPVSEIEEALAIKSIDREVLLAGERDGIRIGGELTGGIEFDLGNSPREMTPDRVRGRRLVSTTTNGTRAIRACASADDVLIASFANLSATASWLQHSSPDEVLLVCSGTGERGSLEDTVGAGGLISVLARTCNRLNLTDSAIMAHQLFESAGTDPATLARQASNARRLLAIPGLADDVDWCLKTDRVPLVAGLNEAGRICIK